MHVFIDLLGDKELSYFTPSDYMILKNVLNDVLAKDVVDYTKHPDANPAVVAAIEKYLGPTLDSLTMHFTLEEKGINALVRSLVPENLPNSRMDLDPLIEKLQFLEDNESKLLTSIPARKRSDYDAFISMMEEVIVRIKSNGDEPTFPDLIDRLKSNSFIFYTTREKQQETGSRFISLRKRQWIVSLRGAQFMKRCEADGISQSERRLF